jgi:hypothetical protein
MGPTKTLNAPGRSPRRGRPPEREQIIADALVGFASELRLTDAAELMSMIQNDQAANLADLVNSSTELYFKSGTMWTCPAIVESVFKFTRPASRTEAG